MRQSIVLLLLALSWTTGCAHKWVPSLPASHGRLSQVYGQLLGSEDASSDRILPAHVPLFNPKVDGDLPPDKARAEFESAVALLKGTPSEAQVRQASVALSVACASDCFEACDYLRLNARRPERIEGPGFPPPPPGLLMTHGPKFVVIQGRVDTDGSMRNLRVVETPNTAYADALAQYLVQTRFRPVTLAGHPIAHTYAFTFVLSSPNDHMRQKPTLAEARHRAEHFSESGPAWADFSGGLAAEMQEGADYVTALQRLNALAPAYWWSAGELAWQYVQAGRYSDAKPLARMARRMAPDNPYVLETLAAVWRNTGHCAQALKEQEAAVAKLHAEWPREERERFQRTLADYQRACQVTAKTAPGAGTP